jgi:hypothetical protein
MFILAKAVVEERIVDCRATGKGNAKTGRKWTRTDGGLARRRQRERKRRKKNYSGSADS